jgi:ferrochelatase
LFNDHAIIGLPWPFRYLLAKLISSRRDKKAQDIYAQINGKSPLLEITSNQAEALEKELSFHGNFKVFIAMRYWHPFASETIEKIKEYQPHEIILLPLYPQFSSSTTASSINDFLEKLPKNIKEKTKIKEGKKTSGTSTPPDKNQIVLNVEIPKMIQDNTFV